MTTQTSTGTRRSLGVQAGDRITVQTWQGWVTGTVATTRTGWNLTDHDAPNGHLPGWGHASRVTIRP